RRSGRGPRRAAARPAADQSPWAPRLAGLESPQPSFVPDVPGSYVFELTVGDGSSSSSDRVEIEVAPRSWLVPIQTMAQREGKNGILVGNAFYPGDGPGDDSRCVVQLLVLDRSALGEGVNRTFGFPGCGADPSADGAP